MMSKASRDKGARLERAVVNLLKAHGIEARRTAPMQSSEGTDTGDVEAEIGGHKRRIECKARANGFRQIYDWLDGADILAVKADSRELLVVMPAATALELLRKGEGNEPR